jgi:hypothetical protein
MEILCPSFTIITRVHLAKIIGMKNSVVDTVPPKTIFQAMLRAELFPSRPDL